MNEVMAMTEVQSGNAAAYQVLVERYQTPITRYLERLLGERAPAEDMAQDAFLDAYYAISKQRYGHLTRKLSSVSPAVIFYHYATRQALDRANPSLLSRLRPSKDKRHTDARNKDVVPPEHTIFAPPPGTVRPAIGESDETGAERAELERLEKDLLRLPREQAACLLLHSMLGFSYPEIAAIVGCSLAQVRTQIGRGRLALLAS